MGVYSTIDTIDHLGALDSWTSRYHMRYGHRTKRHKPHAPYMSKLHHGVWRNNTCF